MFLMNITFKANVFHEIKKEIKKKIVYELL